MAAPALQPIHQSIRPQRRDTRVARRRSRMAQRRARTLSVLFVLVVVALVLLFPRTVHTQPHQELVQYTVAPGDTLWAIATPHAKGRDVRELIYEIGQVNNLGSRPIQPGQVLVIPVSSGSVAGR